MLKAFYPATKRYLSAKVRMSQFSSQTLGQMSTGTAPPAVTESSAIAPPLVPPRIKNSYVVYVYVDYRKEIGTRVIRNYIDRQKAIEFAESLSTKYVDPHPDPDEKEREPEYVCAVGTEFDQMLRFPRNRLVEFGVNSESIKYLDVNRVAVDIAQHFD